MGRAHRETRELALQIGQALARLAQAQDPARAGIRHRRLDRAPRDTRVFRSSDGRSVRRGEPERTGRGRESSLATEGSRASEWGWDPTRTRRGRESTLEPEA